MFTKISRILLIGAAGALMSACGGGSGGSSTMAPPPPAQTGSVSMIVSDASSEDWATIGVKVLSISLVPQSGGANVTVYTAPGSAPMINLVELDQLGELLGNVTVPVGTYTGAVLSVGANSGDILLTAAANPQAGFVAAPGSTVPADQIQIQHVQGTPPNLSVPVKVGFESPLVVTTTQSNQLDLEFDLSHPAFLVGHTPPGAATTLWAVNFEGPVRHHPLRDITRLILRHMYGEVTGIATDNSSLTITREFPTLPAVSPETALQSTNSVQILADATNGTLLYDLDAKTRTVIKNFSNDASLVGKNVRVAARYQENGTLVATRIWASSQFNNVWLSPEGHVLHVDSANNTVTVANEAGRGVPVSIDANTEFFFRQPQSAIADATPIGTGPSFLANQNLVRGFKVHVSVVDPLAIPLVAQSIDIETATYSGRISMPTSIGFTYTQNFATSPDDYSYTIDYISALTANGKDSAGNPLLGFKWWNFAYPTLLDSGPNAISDFIAATNGSVNFGGSVGAVTSRGVSNAIWNDPANSNGWSTNATALTPIALPMGVVSAGLANNAFSMAVAGGTNAVTVDVGTISGSATLVYQVDRTKGIVTVNPIDVTTTTGLTTLTNGLIAGAPVKVYGIPQPDSTLKAYVLVYFTGDVPAV